MPQVQATFAGGLAEHLQAAGGVNAAIASSLKESISQADAVASKLSQDVRQNYEELRELATTEIRGVHFTTDNQNSFLQDFISPRIHLLHCKPSGAVKL